MPKRPGRGVYRAYPAPAPGLDGFRPRNTMRRRTAEIKTEIASFQPSVRARMAFARAKPSRLGDNRRSSRTSNSMTETTTSAQPITRLEPLVEYLASGCRPREQWKIGTEHEKFG